MATKKPPPEADNPLLDDDEDEEERTDGLTAWRTSKWTKQYAVELRTKIAELTRALIRHGISTASVDPMTSFYAGKIIALDAAIVKMGFKSVLGDKEVANG